MTATLLIWSKLCGRISSIFKSILRVAFRFLFLFRFEFERPKRWEIIHPNRRMDLSFCGVDNIIFNFNFLSWCFLFNLFFFCHQIFHFRFRLVCVKLGKIIEIYIKLIKMNSTTCNFANFSNIFYVYLIFNLYIFYVTFINFVKNIVNV